MVRLISSLTPAITEPAVLANSFELLCAFDEVVSLGYKESVSLQQVRNVLEGESHEEKIQEIIARNKEAEAKEELKRRAKQLEMQRREQQRRQAAGGGGAGAGQGYSGGGGGAYGGGSGGMAGGYQAAPRFDPVPAERDPYRWVPLGAARVVPTSLTATARAQVVLARTGRIQAGIQGHRHEARLEEGQAVRAARRPRRRGGRARRARAGGRLACASQRTGRAAGRGRTASRAAVQVGLRCAAKVMTASDSPLLRPRAAFTRPSANTSTSSSCATAASSRATSRAISTCASRTRRLPRSSSRSRRPRLALPTSAAISSFSSTPTLPNLQAEAQTA